MSPQERSLVLSMGAVELDARSFTERRLTLKRATSEEIGPQLNFARALIVAEEAGRNGLIRATLSAHANAAQDYGLLVVVLVQTDQDYKTVSAMCEETPRSRLINVTFAAKLVDIAETIARADNEIGPSAGTVTIEAGTAILTEEQTLLLRRAFWDCDRIRLESLSGGRASECVFRVHAWLKKSEVGPRPLPFFAKIADCAAIGRERSNYAQLADHYIPFNLRPNLIRRRCVQSSKYAALVGNFVEDAVPLRSSLRSGQGVGAIFSLFEGSLKGLRMQPFVSQHAPLSGGLDLFLKDRARVAELSPEIVQTAMDLELKKTPQVLQNWLVEKAQSVTLRWGPFHGDLHAGNVMVRQRDAILIDFGNTGSGPLTADPAALEVSLMFGFDENVLTDDFEAWRTFVDSIYPKSPRSLSLRPPLPETNPSQWGWLLRALRELRHVLLCCECEEIEARLVLSAYLLRYGRLPLEATAGAAKRHAYALVVAERIIDTL